MAVVGDRKNLTRMKVWMRAAAVPAAAGPAALVVVGPAQAPALGVRAAHGLGPAAPARGLDRLGLDRRGPALPASGPDLGLGRAQAHARVVPATAAHRAARAPALARGRRVRARPARGLRAHAPGRGRGLRAAAGLPADAAQP